MTTELSTVAADFAGRESAYAVCGSPEEQAIAGTTARSPKVVERILVSNANLMIDG
ncbi:MAG TPA: hypothetical protein VJ825_04780 [Gemmatimonadaceae bacterium]|nr:hypothetical protein [Gemmatimonadaceae bacterium]